MLWAFLYTPYSADDDLQRFPMLFVYCKKESRQHDKHHENTGNAVTEQTLAYEIYHQSKSDANTEADDLPQGQTK